MHQVHVTSNDCSSGVHPPTPPNAQAWKNWVIDCPLPRSPLPVQGPELMVGLNQAVWMLCSGVTQAGRRVSQVGVADMAYRICSCQQHGSVVHMAGGTRATQRTSSCLYADSCQMGCDAEVGRAVVHWESDMHELLGRGRDGGRDCHTCALIAGASLQVVMR
jgi:hypothetical protein